jgi:DNA-binding response OmpR family regulator
MNILIVDDEEDTRRFLVDLISGAGHRVETANDGLEAMAALQISRFDAVLLDLMMPRVDGYQVLRFLSDQWTPVPLPVIVISCRRDEESRSYSKMYGCARYLPKPFEPRALMAALQDIDRGREEGVAKGA